MQCWNGIIDSPFPKRIVLPRVMTGIKAWLLASIAILAGCAAQRTSPYPDVASALSAPLPQNDQELTRQCDYLRQEIAQQRTIESTAATTLPGTTILSIQEEASQNIAALMAKSAKLGCDAVFNAKSEPTATQEYGAHIDTCMAKCKQYTSRTPEQCFDSCK
jgi:hypothetical protein